MKLKLVLSVFLMLIYSHSKAQDAITGLPELVSISNMSMDDAIPYFQAMSWKLNPADTSTSNNKITIVQSFTFLYGTIKETLLQIAMEEDGKIAFETMLKSNQQNLLDLIKSELLQEGYSPSDNLTATNKVSTYIKIDNNGNVISRIEVYIPNKGGSDIDFMISITNL